MPNREDELIVEDEVVVPTPRGRFVGGLTIPPLEGMTDAEIDDLAGVIADTMADAMRAEEGS